MGTQASEARRYANTWRTRTLPPVRQRAIQLLPPADEIDRCLKRHTSNQAQEEVKKNLQELPPLDSKDKRRNQPGRVNQALLDGANHWVPRGLVRIPHGQLSMREPLVEILDYRSQMKRHRNFDCSL